VLRGGVKDGPDLNSGSAVNDGMIFLSYFFYLIFVTISAFVICLICV